jgi:hypothetical protein
MARRRKLSKQQLKRDAFVETTFEASEFFQEHWQRILTYVGIVIVAVALYFGGKSYLESTKTNAQNMLASAVKAMEDGNYTAAKDSLQLLLDGFAFSKLKEDADYYKAEVSYKEKNFAEAEKLYKEYIDKYGYTGKYIIPAGFNLAVSQEQQTLMLQAAQSYLEFAKNINIEKISLLAKNEALRCLIAGKSYDDAQKLAEELLPLTEDINQKNLLKLQLGFVEGAKLEPVTTPAPEATPAPTEVTPE